MKQTEREPDDQIKAALDLLRPVSSLDPQAIAQERVKFLAQGETFRQAVSKQAERRQIGWINTLVQFFQKKERNPMFYTLMSIFVSIAILFGGGGATVVAAQDSLPGEPLYSVKSWSENSRLSLANSAQERLNLTLEFTNRRVDEITRLQAVGKSIPESVAVRMQDQLESALQIAAGMEDPQMIQALAQIHLQTEIQTRSMANLLRGAQSESDPILRRIHDRLQDQLRLCTTGETDPESFRLQVRDRQQIRLNGASPTQNSTQPGSTPQNPNATPDPSGNSYGPGSGNQDNDNPGHYGPGQPNPSQTPAPSGGSYGPGPGQPSSTPGSYGPGPSAGTATCTPVQDGTGPGPGPKPTQTNQPGGPGPSNPTSTPQPGGPGSGPGKPTETPGKGGGKP